MMFMYFKLQKYSIQKWMPENRAGSSNNKLLSEVV